MMPVLVAVVAVLVLMLGGKKLTIVGPWYRGLRKSALQPPDWLFGPAWGVVLTAAGTAGVLAWRASGAGEWQAVAAAFGLNCVLHFLWSPAFFVARRPDWALVDVVLMWLSIVAMMVASVPAPLAVWLLVPYLLWVSYAAWLNLVIVRRNAPFA